MLHQPVGQKRLTNIAIVRLRSHGCKFEIACYKNKVGNWRDGLERDIDEVLTTTQVFSNVSQGVFAKQEDLKKAFGNLSELEICKKILDKGEFQVSDKERANALDSMYKETYTMITRRCVNPETRRPLTMGMAEAAVKQSGYVMKPNLPIKRQALKAIECIIQKLPHLVAKAQMRLCARCLGSAAAETRALIERICRGTAQIESEKLVESAEYMEIVFQCDPFFFRELDKVVEVRVLDATVIREGDTNLDDELGRYVDEDLDEDHLEDNNLLVDNNSGTVCPLTRDKLQNYRPGQVFHPDQVGGGDEASAASSLSASARPGASTGAGVSPMQQSGSGFVVDFRSPPSKSTDSYHFVGGTPQSHQDWLVIPEGGSTGAGGATASSPRGGGESGAAAGAGQQLPGGAALSCTTCGAFEDETLRAHMKSDWHQENVKRKCGGKPVFSFPDYKEYLLDMEFVNERMGGKEKRGKKNRK